MANYYAHEQGFASPLKGASPVYNSPGTTRIPVQDPNVYSPGPGAYVTNHGYAVSNVPVSSGVSNVLVSPSVVSQGGVPANRSLNENSRSQVYQQTGGVSTVPVVADNYQSRVLTSTSTANTQPSYLSEVEAAILRSNVPININETEEITVNGHRGIWANKSEVVNWRGVMPITDYHINEDASPEIITKRTEQTLTYIQELAIRYLRPPTPPAPGEIIITQETNTLTPPAPPLIIRQQPPRPSTPEPLVIREAPPPPPVSVGRKVITISGKRLPPPPRKVIIERLAPLPSKPQAVLIERWLPYSQVKRRVIFQKTQERDPVVVKPRNVIVQWEAPQVVIKKDFKYLGIIRANPVEYVQRYGSSLKTSKELPDFVLDIKPPAGVVLAADYQYNQTHELEGDLHALRFVDLDREGLSEYRSQLQRLGIPNTAAPTNYETNVNNNNNAQRFFTNTQVNSNNYSPPVSPTYSNNYSYSTGPPNVYNQYTTNAANNLYSPSTVASSYGGFNSVPPNSYSTAAATAGASFGYNSSPIYNHPAQGNYVTSPMSSPHAVGNYTNTSTNSAAASIISDLFSNLDRDLNGRITVEEAEKLLLKLNSRLGRRYGEEDIKRFFLSLDTNRDGTIDFQEFKLAFERVL